MAASRARDGVGGSPHRRASERGGRSPTLARSTVGRPRTLSDREVARVLFEYARFLAWKALRKAVKSQRQLARELGVSAATVSYVIRIQGAYKQVSPERRDAQIQCRRGKLMRLRTRGLL